MNKRHGGILPALPTPFTKEEKLNLPALDAFVKAMAQDGADGFYICGGTSEMPMIYESERREILESVVDTVHSIPGGEELQLIAHVGSVNLREACSLARHAATLKVDSVSSVLPYYVSLSYDEIERYYRALADASGLPVVIYNVPAAQTSNLSRLEFVRLMALPEIGGIKFTSTDFYTLETLHATYPDKLIFNGSDQALLSGLSAGADGGIGTTYNVMVKKFLRLHHAFLAGKMDEAYAYQHEVNTVIALMQKIGCMKAVKCVLRLRGYEFGDLLLPNDPITDADMAFVAQDIMPLIAD